MAKKKKKRKYNPNLVKLRHSYTLAEIAEVYGVHTRTVQSWRKRGLKAIDETSKPYLVIGEDIRGFLEENSQKRKHPLRPGEFFCPRCQRPRNSLQDHFSVEITNRKLGKKCKQSIIRGTCDVCLCKLFRFSSDRKVQELKEKRVTLAEHKTTLIGSGGSFVNTDIKRGENRESKHQK
jgi:hypothetical protein